MRNLNIVGPQIRRFRNQLGWSQSRLALKLQIAGWDISRVGVAKVEAQLVWVGDHQLLHFAAVFQVEIKDLYPPIPRDVKLYETIEKLQTRRRPPKK